MYVCVYVSMITLCGCGISTPRTFTRGRSSRRRHSAEITTWPPHTTSLTPQICRVFCNVPLLLLFANLVDLRCGMCAVGDLPSRALEVRISGAADPTLQGSHLRTLQHATGNLNSCMPGLSLFMHDWLVWHQVEQSSPPIGLWQSTGGCKFKLKKLNNEKKFVRTT